MSWENPNEIPSVDRNLDPLFSLRMEETFLKKAKLSGRTIEALMIILPNYYPQEENMVIPVKAFGLFFVILVVVAAAAASVLAPTAASGHGTLLVPNADGKGSIRRQFSFSARTSADGTVKGNAVLINPQYNGDKSQYYQLQIDISCMYVSGNTAFFGGTTRRTNDPNLVDAVYFIAQDNGEPGGGHDQISPAVFFDDDPNTTGDPGLCVNIQLGDPNFPMYTIESGNVVVH